jgi:hypothetical protein
MRTEEDQSRPEAIVNPIPLSLRASPEDSLSALDRLRKESLPHLEELCSRLQAETGLISEIHSKSTRSAEEKSRRPSVRRGKPWFTVAHIRDFLRFRTSFGSIQEAQKLLRFSRLKSQPVE